MGYANDDRGDEQAEGGVILAIDPGTTESAWVVLSAGKPVAHAKEPNHALLKRLRAGEHHPGFRDALTNLLAIEGIASYGMAVGKEVFETCMWSGRFREAWEYRGGAVQIVYRKEVKIFHCDTARANDANIRAALIDRFGGKEAAIGSKASPGPLHGIKSDRWAALALALTAEGKPVAAPLFREPHHAETIDEQKQALEKFGEIPY